MSQISKFAHHLPFELGQALELMDRCQPNVRILAGGTEILPKLRSGRLQPDHLISVNRLSELRTLEFDIEQGLTIGAGVRIRDVADFPPVRQNYPPLAKACSEMATVQIRNMGTIAGNLVNGSPCADTAGPLLVHDARVLLVSTRGEREVALSDFFLGPGQVAKDPREILTAIRVPAPGARVGSAYLRLSARSKVDMAAVSASSLLELDEKGRIVKARLALGAVDPTPIRCPEGEKLLIGELPSPELLVAAAQAGAKHAHPIDDVRGTAAYRRTVTPVLLRRVLETSLVRARGETPQSVGPHGVRTATSHAPNGDATNTKGEHR